MFIRAYEEHGKNWKKIAEIVGTRSVSQVRSHAQKYFMKLERRSAREQARLKKAAFAATASELPKMVSIVQNQSPDKLMYENNVMRTYIQTIANVNLAFFRQLQTIFRDEQLGADLEESVLLATAWTLPSSPYPSIPAFSSPYV